MVHITVAIARFMEIIIWEILAAAGVLIAYVLMAAGGLAAVMFGILWLVRRVRR